jgi:hypothetical protein
LLADGMSTSPPLESEPLEPRWTPALIPGVLGLAAVAFAIAASVSSQRLQELAWLRSVPRADPAARAEEPARYAGRLHGPAGRSTPAGDRAAAYWWAIVYRDAEGDKTVYGSGRERSRLVLETPSGSLPLAFTEAEPQYVGLIHDEKDDEYDMPISIDLGNTRHTVSEAIPPGQYAGEDAKYEQVFLPEGAAVEVVGCMKAGAIDACRAPLHAVLAAPALEVHRRHRAGQAKDPFRAAIATVAVVLGLVGSAFGVLASLALRGGPAQKSEDSESP